jgi:hypothetical protein
MAKKSKKTDTKAKSEKKEKPTKKVESVKKAEKKKKASSPKPQPKKETKKSSSKETKKADIKLKESKKTSKSKSNEIKNTKSEKISQDKNKENKEKMVQLKTTDNKIYDVPKDILAKSKLLSGLIEDYEVDGIISEDISLCEVNNENLELILEYLKHYKNDEPKEIPKPFPERTDEDFFRGILDDDWTYNFLTKLNIEQAINLTNAAYYLQIDGLINILAAKLAHEMCNCEIEEARRKFGIECDMTEEQVAEYDKYPLD